MRNWYKIDGKVKEYPYTAEMTGKETKKRPVFEFKENDITESATPYRFTVITYNKNDENAESFSEPRDFWSKPKPVPLMVQHWKKSQTKVPLIFKPFAENNNVNPVEFTYTFQRREYTPDRQRRAYDPKRGDREDEFFNKWETRLTFNSKQRKDDSDMIDISNVK